MLRNVDGDTLHCRVDLGIDVRIDLVLRLAGINAPEIATDAGKLTAKYVAELIPINAPIIIRTAKDRHEKYGRYLAWVFVPGAVVSINEALVNRGLAVPYGDLPVAPP